MEETIVACPKCFCKNWEYTPHTERKDFETYKCIRCGYRFKLGKCSKCRKMDWKFLKDEFEKGSRRKITRYRCNSCGRTVVIIQDQP